jgi:predicted nucleotidyltransferase component of viral defense system
LKHRQSHDLDFFTAVEELIVAFSQKLEARLKDAELKTERLRTYNSFVELSVSSEKESTIIHLASDSPFRFESPIEHPDFPGLKIDSLIDMASNKLIALFSRAALRDFIDIYFLIKKYYKKNELIEKAQQKDPGFDLYWLGVAFERIHGYAADSPNMHMLTIPCSLQELITFFDAWRNEIAASL